MKPYYEEDAKRAFDVAHSVNTLDGYIAGARKIDSIIDREWAIPQPYTSLNRTNALRSLRDDLLARAEEIKREEEEAIERARTRRIERQLFAECFGSHAYSWYPLIY